MNPLITALFETDALRICPENQPFWYTSGKIGPYYINTHFLYGSEKEATDLLSYIDSCLVNKMSLPEKVFQRVLSQYTSNALYKSVIDNMVNYVKEHIDLSKISYISGGERRDWFFSNIIAYLLKKDHITIYKDLSCVISNHDFTKTEEISSAMGNSLHIADLVTEASSYIRAWIPALGALGANMSHSLVVVDRMQGGTAKIEEKGILAHSLIKIDKNLFQYALDNSIINNTQLEMLNGYFDTPDETMKKFVKNHPEFLENALNSDEKTIKRAKLCIEQKFYE